MPIAGVAAAADGRIFAITRNHEHPIISLLPEGEYIGSVGAQHGFISEHGIFIDGHGSASVHRFAKDGKWVYTWGGPGDAPARFRLPHSIWLDPLGGVWVADRDNCRVALYDRDGALIRCFEPVYPLSGMYGPSDIWGDERHVYVGQNSVCILVYDIQARAACGIIEAHEGSAALGHSQCGDGAGNLFVGHLAPPFSVSKLEQLN